MFAFQFLLHLGSELIVILFLAVGKNGEIRDAQVNPDGRCGFWPFVDFFFTQKGHEILAACIFADGCTQYPVFGLAAFRKCNQAQFRQFNEFFVYFDAVVYVFGCIALDGILLAFEFRLTVLFSEKSGKRIR